MEPAYKADQPIRPVGDETSRVEEKAPHARRPGKKKGSLAETKDEFIGE